MPPLTVVAKVVARKDSAEAVERELLRLIAPTRKEDGCIEYKLHRDSEDPALFIFYETWESPAALDMHMNTEHFKAYIAAVDGMIEDKAVYKMTRIDEQQQGA